MTEADVLDVAVVGGGVSGVYAAWRLLTQGQKTQVTVFEGSDHIGGRLLSVRPPKIDNMVAELGGMRVLLAVQPRIRRLLNYFNAVLPEDQRPVLFDFPVDKPANIAFLRGTYLRLADFTTHPEKVPYRLDFLEQGNTAGQILVNAIEQIVPGITHKGLTEEERRDMTRRATFDGKPLHQMGFWQVLSRVISNEAYHLGIEAAGYHSVLSNWNAADAIPWFLSDFGIDPQYKGFKNGFQQVPEILAGLVQQSGGKIVFEKKLRSFHWNSDEKWVELTFQDGTQVKAAALILAMPRRALEIVAEDTPFLRQPQVRRLVGSVTPRPLFKLFTTYDNPWWQAAGVQEGRTVTDLPVRQTYYWPTDTGAAASAGRAMLMASYDDGDNVGYWDSFRPRRRHDWLESDHSRVAPDDPFIGEDDSEQAKADPSAWNRYRAPQRMVDEVQRQLGLIHGMSYVPQVRAAAFRDWGDDPFGGGWNSWNIGVKSWEVIRDILQPQKDAPVYICGEAYSDAQGWVEGALQTAELMLETHFDLPHELPDA